jgi:two-component system phosphate regulon response regulator OmpR
MWQPHILVVDDDRRLRDLLRKYLMDQNVMVSTATDAADAEAKLEAAQFDLMVLDVMMPGEDGYAFTKRLRGERKTRDLPILLLTARAESDDRINGLEAGSDDYLVKPFEPRELQLRINAILRRRPAATGQKEVWIGRWQYDASRNELRDETDVVRLTDVEASLMKVFAEYPGEAISREQLVERSALPINDRTVDVQVTRLRRKIEPDPKQPRYLVTVRGEGYMLLPEREAMREQLRDKTT